MNYIGSKYSLLDFLQTTIEKVTGYKSGKHYVFADLFAGTGVVGQAYREKGCTVIANDIQYYSYVLNKHIVENTSDVDSSLFDYFNSLEPVEGFVYKNYCEGSGSGRNYFTDENGKKCDAIRMELERLKNEGKISMPTYYFYLASLVNSIDKYANTASVYGAFLKHIKKSAQKTFVLEPLPIVPGVSGTAYNEDINELTKKISGDVLYLDPPYNARQYCTNYHVLETIAKYDNPELSGVTGLREYSEQKSLFCSKRTVAAAFEDLIKNANFKYIFLSYNNEGLMSLDTIKEIMSKYGEYSFYTQEYKRFKADKDANRNIIANSTTEYLHCLVKKDKRKTSKYNDIDMANWKDYGDITTDSLWHIEKRDNSGAHSGDYHGNFVPQIPNQLFRRYTKKGDWILDPFMGSGTSLIEAQRLGRNSIGIDLQPEVANEANSRIQSEKTEDCVAKTFSGDSRNIDMKEVLSSSGTDKVQFVIMHPPYWDIIKFSDNENDLSNSNSLEDFLDDFGQVIDNSTKYLEKNRYCAVVIGDKYANSQVVPLGFHCMNKFIEKGFMLKAILVKNFGDTKGKTNQQAIWRYRALASDFYVFKHEYIFVFKKVK